MSTAQLNKAHFPPGYQKLQEDLGEKLLVSHRETGAYIAEATYREGRTRTEGQCSFMVRRKASHRKEKVFKSRFELVHRTSPFSYKKIGTIDNVKPPVIYCRPLKIGLALYQRFPLHKEFSNSLLHAAS